NDVTCTIGPGVTALLGMNGAGKTTMMRLITGQIKANTGQVRVLGHDPFANPDVYRLLGYCPDVDAFYESMTGRQFVTLMARLAGFSSSEARRRADEAIERVGMAQRADRKLAGYSKGMRQRIKLAQAMLHDPSIILLDEPLNGLDPGGRREFILLLRHLADEGKSIIVSSHILFEVEQMTRSILLLHRGRLRATGDLRVIRELIDRHPHRIRIESPKPRELAARLVGLPFVLSVQLEAGGEALEIQTREPGRFYDALPDLVEQGTPILGLSSPDNNLEAVFRYLVES
ncbi:MAG: ABC transporter ATP-binding protein, partial [Fimbriimonadales bacterium]|nr:ABC transporter ATP-binding protein [Fimbriimonadales bacterium]